MVDRKLFTLILALVLVWHHNYVLAQYDEECEYECTIVYCDHYGDYCDYDCYEVCYPYRYATMMQSQTDLQATKSADFAQTVKSSLQSRLRQSQSARSTGSNKKSRTGKVVRMRIQTPSFQGTHHRGNNPFERNLSTSKIALFQSCVSNMRHGLATPNRN